MEWLVCLATLDGVIDYQSLLFELGASCVCLGAWIVRDLGERFERFWYGMGTYLMTSDCSTVQEKSDDGSTARLTGCQSVHS